MSSAAPVALGELWVTRCPVPTATSIALDRGWLTEEFAGDGISVTTLQDPAGAGHRESHFTHELAALVREGGNVPALWARSRGAETRLVGLTWIDEHQAVVGRPGRAADGLRGLRLALPRRDGSIDFWRAMALRGHLAAIALEGLQPGDVTFVDVPGGRESPRLPDGRADHYAAELAALRDGRVDAVYVKGAPGVEATSRVGAAVIADLGTHPDPAVRINNGTPRPITVDARLLHEHGDLVARLLAVLVRTAAWAREHPEEVAAIVAGETAAGASGVGEAYADLHLRLDLDLSAHRLGALADQRDFLHRHGFLAGAVDLDRWVDHHPLTTATDLVAQEHAR